MDKFIARENIRHCRDRLETETDPAMRSRLHTLLIEEEDKLGRNSAMLRDVEIQIANGKKRVNRQQALIASMERDGHDMAQAIALLNAFSETLLVYENHRQAILITLKQSRL